MVKQTTICGKSVCTFVPENKINGLLVLCIDKAGTLSRALEYIEKNMCREFSLACICVQPTQAYTDFTPWVAGDIYSGQPPFSGGADNYLNELYNDFLPNFLNENNLSFEISKKAIVGFSLGGLMSLYTFVKDSYFGNLGICSGSVWYPNLINWLGENDLSVSDANVYISMGDREQTDFFPQMSNLNRQVKEIKTILEDKLNNPNKVKFEWTTGEHGDNVPMRLAQAMLYLESKM